MSLKIEKNMEQKEIYNRYIYINWCLVNVSEYIKIYIPIIFAVRII